MPVNFELNCYSEEDFQYGTRWFFDDPDYGLVKEELVDGVPEIIEELLAFKKAKKINIKVTTEALLGYEVLEFYKYDRGGVLYEYGPLVGWLCPSFWCYFDKKLPPPQNLYVKLEVVE